MRKSIKLLSLICASAFAVSAFSGCKGGDKGQQDGEIGGLTGGELNIMYFQGGYGKEWLERIATDYEEAYDCKVNLTDDTKPGEDLNEKWNLQKGNRVPDYQDIYFCQAGLQNWEKNVSQGKVANLDEVYDTEVTKLDGTKIKISDYMEDYAVAKYTREQRYGDGQPHKWSMPWGSITIGMLVNLDILEETKHKTTVDGQWSVGDTWKTEELEASYDNLMLYYDELDMEAIAEKQNAERVAKGQDKIAYERYAKFGLNANDSHWVQNAIYCWWAQYQGVYEENEANGVSNGAFYDFFNWESPEVLKQEGLLNAMEMLQNMIVDKNTKSYKNIPQNYGEMDLQRLEINYMSGIYATMLGGSFIENEAGIYNTDGIRYQLISIPNCPDAQLDEDGNPISVVYNTINETVVVPAKAKNIGHAKQFLAFMCNEKYLVDFTQKTGTLRPFDYDPVALAPDFNWSDMQRKVVDMNQSADYKLVTYPVKALQQGNLSPMAVMHPMGMYGDASHIDVFAYLKTRTIEEIMITGFTGYKGAYNMTKDNWDGYLQDI